MTLKIVDGRVFYNNEELFILTNQQQDEVIKLLYPKDNKLKTIPQERKRQSSWSGTHKYDLDTFASLSKPYVEEGNCEIQQRVYKWGGVRLVTLYCNSFDYASAALDLGITKEALTKWFQRWKKRAIKSGLTPELLFG